MKRIMSLLLVLVCIAGMAAAEKPEKKMTTVWVLCQPDSYVVIRSSPRKTGLMECRAYAGDDFQTDGKKKNGYLHVYGPFEAQDGWISARYMTESQPEIYPSGKKMTVWVKSVNCRWTIGGKRKGVLKRGAVVTVWLETEEWCVTNRGYIQTKYLEA